MPSSRDKSHAINRHRAELIGLLYDAVLYHEARSLWLEKMAEHCGARSGLLVLQNPRTLEIAHTEQVGFDSESRKQYDSNYRMHDVWTREMLRLPREAVYPSEAVVAKAEFKKSLIYNEFCKPLDILHGAAAFLAINETWTVRFCLQRTRVQGEFRQAEIRQIQTIVPHLRRSIMISETVGMLRSGMDVLLDHFGTACILITSLRQVISLNSLADALLPELPCIRITQGRLVIKHGDLADRLEKLLHDCEGPNLDEPSGSMQCMKLPRKHGAPIILSAIPAPCRADFPLFGNTVLLIFKNPEKKHHVDTQVLVDMYGLTPTEARVAALLGAGFPIKRIAAQLSVSVNAIKFHVKSIYDKTDIHRQPDLVSLILRVSGRGST